MRRTVLVFLMFGLAACSTPVSPNVPIGSGSASISSPEQTQSRLLESAPSEVSLKHFSEMRLVGSGLTLREISRNEAYTQYAADYFSNGLRISGIMNIPNGDGPFPLVLTNHGHIDPSIYTRGRGLRREQDFLARRGFAILHSDYRGHGESDPSPVEDEGSYDAGIEYSMDVLNAIQAVRDAALPQVDASRVGMLGHSMGGGISLNIAVAHPDAVDAIALYASVHVDAWENFNRWRRERPEGDRTLRELGTRAENPARWDRLSSLTYLDDLRAPVILFQGSNDQDVPKEWSYFLATKLESIGKNITYVGYEGEAHEFGPQWTDFMQKTADFFDAHLRRSQSSSFVSGWPLFETRRITKKPFGILIDRETSPVQPERFAGYHTGADFEVLPGEDETTMAVPAICEGEVGTAQNVSGYGGVVMQRCTIGDESVTVLYGHLSLDSIEVTVGQMLSPGQTIGRLGKGFSAETDNERPHLHLSIHKGAALEFRGYEQVEAELQRWLDPVPWLPVVYGSTSRSAPVPVSGGTGASAD